MKSHKNIMLSGFSGSGKTTLANHISETFGMRQVVSSDTIHTKLRTLLPSVFKKGEVDIHSHSYRLMQVVTKCIQGVDMLVKSRLPSGVVYDACNLQQSVRDKMRKILGNDALLIYVTANEQDILSRLWQRENPEVWRELFEQQKRDFDEKEFHPDLVYDSSKFSLYGDFARFDRQLRALLESKIKTPNRSIQ